MSTDYSENALGCKRSRKPSWCWTLRTRADVFSTVKTVLDDLPRIFTPELYQQKCDTVYQHVYDSYPGEGQSIYESV